MRYSFGFLCVCALGVLPLVGCVQAAPNLCGGVECDDGSVCTEDACDPATGTCEYAPVADGTACGDDKGTCQDGTCEVACTEQGIRDAVAAGGGPYTFDCDGPKTVVTETTIEIDNDVVLDGEGNLTVDGDESHRVFDVGRCFDLVMFQDCEERIAVRLQGITVTRGLDGIVISQGVDFELIASVVSDNTGHGIDSNSERIVTVTGSTISGNDCCTMPGTGCFCTGGGVFSGSSTLVLTDTNVSDNTAEQGGGIYSGGVLKLVNSTVSENVSRTWGGGMVVGEGTIINSTVSGNTAMDENPTGGGGILHGEGEGPLTIINSTVSSNVADQGGSAITTFGGRLTWGNSLIDGDCSLDPPEEVPGERVSLGHNIESPGNTCGFDTNKGDLFDVTPEQLNLGPLADNGGPTMAHALLTDPIVSVAINRIPEAECVDAEGVPLTTDQRGEPRPDTGGTMCDVGAFERQPNDP